MNSPGDAGAAPAPVETGQPCPTAEQEESCIFCRIVRGEIPARKVYEDETVIAFHDTNPQAPVHVLIIPRKHLASLSDLEAADGELLRHIHRVILELAAGLTSDPESADYRIVVNNGAKAGQSVFHLHYHFLAGRRFNWPPG